MSPRYHQREVLTADEQFLFRSADSAGVILKSAAESALLQVIGQRDIGDATILYRMVQYVQNTT